MAVLAAGMLLAGCSKEESSEEQNRNNMEQTNTLTKEQIVGVWRSGDYWVSFSESGYNSAFLNINGDERIDEGSYTIKGDTVEVEHTLYFGETRYVINSISSTSLQMTIAYNYYPFYPSDDNDFWIYAPITLSKTTDIPCEKNDGLDGTTYENETTFTYEGNAYDVTHANTIHSDGHYILYSIDYHGNKPYSSYGGVPMGGMKFYIYLKPYLYTAICGRGGNFYPNTPIEKTELP